MEATESYMLWEVGLNIHFLDFNSEVEYHQGHLGVVFISGVVLIFGVVIIFGIIFIFCAIFIFDVIFTFEVVFTFEFIYIFEIVFLIAIFFVLQRATAPTNCVVFFQKSIGTIRCYLSYIVQCLRKSKNLGDKTDTHILGHFDLLILEIPD